MVTARKVAEDVFDVPMSVQVVDGHSLDLTSPTNLYELQFDVPGLVTANIGMNGSGIALRGVTDETGQSLAVAPHFNGVYLGRSSLALSRTFDVDRIEVLKGPQGALYGRNATGGSINVITRAPESEFSSTFESAIGSFDTVRVRGHVNLAGERVAVRIAGVRSDGDGYIRNSVDERAFAEQDYGAARLSVLTRPTEKLTVSLTAEHMNDDGGSDELWLPNRAFLANPDDIYLASVTHPDPYLWIENDLLAVELDRDLGTGTLTAITGYARNHVRDIDDCGGGPLPQGCVRSYQPRVYEQRSQEVRFASPGSGRHDWMVGLYVLDADDLSVFRLSIPGPGVLSDYSAEQEEKESALFGRVGYAISERSSFNGGVRFSRDTNRVTSSGKGARDDPTPASQEDSWDNTSWRLGYEHARSENAVYYASIATGFKAGGTSERHPNGEFRNFRPEKLTAYEAGLRLRLPARPWTMDGSLFLYDIRDLQVVGFDVVSNVPVFVIENATDARVRGFDLAAMLRLGGRLSFSGNLVWMPTREFVDFESDSSGITLSGNKLSRAPEWTSSFSLTYERPVRGLAVSMRAQYAHRSDFFFTKENEPASAQQAFGLLNIFVRIEPRDGQWYAFASMRNLLDTDYFTQAFIQSSPGMPANYELGFGLRFPFTESSP